MDSFKVAGGSHVGKAAEHYMINARARVADLHIT